MNDTFRKLLKEVLGYDEDEISQMVSEPIGRNIVTNLTVEQAKEIAEIFADNGFTLYLNPGRYEEDIVYWNQLGLSLSHHPPKAHYGGKPLVSRAHLYESSIPRSFFIKPEPEPKPAPPALEPRPTIECPYCHSTDTTKIGRMEIVLTEVVIGLLFGRHRFSPRRYKEWHCNHCGSDF
ncbi:hypothetical protein AALB16_10780 [Lachnospiraceae bacterium 62-35]